ncbi:UvrD-helicase domain-containing protein [Mesorhizobium sp.]|uniref:UvrD-helicase domain-containing protein n=1 Tax=Mesorhizobium sp. TaxID=1871066 RepID=UPI0025B8BDB7|nr:UvrD-helicase domain-containing protein [Mesorhizobium sp.]
MTTPDEPARITVLTDLDNTLLVEAAAGTGKTSLLAGRVTMLLARGVAPESIAAITFTELAAAELRARVDRFVGALLKDEIPDDLCSALPEGVSAPQRAALATARPRLGALTAATIHSFCLSILQSYAVEARIDPGAVVIDADQSALAFRGVFDAWLRRRLGDSARADDPVVIIARHDPEEAVKTLEGLAKARLRYRETRQQVVAPDPELAAEFQDAVADFRRWIDAHPAPAAALNDADDFAALARFYDGVFEGATTFESLWTRAHPPALSIMKKRSRDIRDYQRRSGAWNGAAGKADGERLSDEARAHYESCAASFAALLGPTLLEP